MSNNRRRYREVRTALKKLYPTEPRGNLARHLNTLAGLISGIIGSESTHLPKVAKKTPDKAKRESRTVRFTRWVKNERIELETYFMPFAQILLAALAHVPLVGAGCGLQETSTAYCLDCGQR